MSKSHQKDKHMSNRAERAAKIIGEPDGYKICEGCESILTTEAITCPNCHSYRFNDDTEAVISHARFLATRPQTSITQEDMY